MPSQSTPGPFKMYKQHYVPAANAFSRAIISKIKAR